MQRETGLDEQAALVSALRLALQAAGTVELFETHISWVLVAAGYAYKIKKAVRFDFLDFSTRAARRHFCLEEVRLNRRLAPQLYLDVVPIAGSVAAPRLGGPGEPIDYAVRMRAFAQDALWSRRIAAGLLSPAEIDALARQLAAFHAAASRATACAPPASTWGSPQALRQAAEENIAALAPLAADAGLGGEVAALRAWQDERLATLGPVFAARRAAGWVRECHGDLHSANILTLDGQVAIFDCIEFNDALRWIDVLHDLAFLYMDLRQRGLPRLAARLLNDYLEATGDYDGAQVLRYYEAQCALVRAKVALLRAAQLDQPAARAERAGAASLLATALAAAHPPPPAIVVMHGLSGSGKSTLARQLAEALPAVQLRSDVERKRMHGIDPSTRPAPALANTLYGPAATQAVYARLGTLAGVLDRAGLGVVIDACNLKRSERDTWRALAAACGVPLLFVAVDAPDATLRARIRERRRAGADPSDADEAVFEQQVRWREPLSGDELACTVRVDSAVAFEPQRVLDALRQLQTHLPMCSSARCR
jgi:aminoglycoside phosphotransferase family enzyme/predicted kinase